MGFSTDPNRKIGAPVMSDPAKEGSNPQPLAPAVSPTGAPLIPPKLVPWLTILAVAAGVVAGLPTMGVALPPVVVGVATGIVGILAAIGIASPGLRK